MLWHIPLARLVLEAPTYGTQMWGNAHVASNNLVRSKNCRRMVVEEKVDGEEEGGRVVEGGREKQGRKSLGGEIRPAGPFL